MDYSLLKKLGLSDGTVQLYKTMLEEGVSTIEEIRQKTGFERRNIYDMLAKLVEKGFVTHSVVGKQKRYNLASPKRILDNIDEKMQGLSEMRIAAETEVEKFEEILKRRKARTAAEIYEGKNAVKNLFYELLEAKENFFIGGNCGVLKFLPSNFWPQLNALRKRKKVFWHDLVQAGSAFPEFVSKNQAELRKNELYEWRILPQVISGPAVVFIYPPKVAHLIWSENPIAFVVSSEEISKSFVEYFWLLWESSLPPNAKTKQENTEVTQKPQPAKYYSLLLLPASF